MTDALDELRDSVPDALRSVLEELDSHIVQFIKTEKDDDPDCVLLEEMVADAVLFIATLPPLLPLPHVGITFDGQILFEWNLSPRKHVVVALEGDGNFDYHMKKGKEMYPGIYEGTVGEELPEDLIEYLEG